MWTVTSCPARDSARVETYWQVFHREAGADGAEDYDYLAGGRYLDTFERRDGEWRIAHTGYVRIYESSMSLDDWPSWKLTANRWAS